MSEIIFTPNLTRDERDYLASLVEKERDYWYGAKVKSDRIHGDEYRDRQFYQDQYESCCKLLDKLLASTHVNK